jgi:hypothetical protein
MPGAVILLDTSISTHVPVVTAPSVVIWFVVLSTGAFVQINPLSTHTVLLLA